MLEEEKKKLAEALKKVSQNDSIPCAKALEAAQRLEVDSRDIARMANELKIKIVRCQLGCF